MKNSEKNLTNDQINGGKLAPIKPYSKKELKKLFGYGDYRTFNEAIQEISVKINAYHARKRVYSPKEVQIIFEFLGHPLVFDSEKSMREK